MLPFLVPVLIVLIVLAVVFVTRFKRCPPDKILVVFGKVEGEDGVRCYHGGGAFVLPLIQDYRYLSAAAVGIDVEVDGTPSKDEYPVTVRSAISVGVQTSRDGMVRAAKRYLSYPGDAFAAEIEEAARCVPRGRRRARG